LDPEKKKAAQREHRVKNLAKVREADTRRYERDKDKRISLAEAHGHIRRARRVQAPFEPGITRIALRKIHGDRCFYCGVTMRFTRAKNREFNSNDATIEHRLPLSRGGKHVWANTVLACRECNLSKNLKTEEEFQEYRLRLQGGSPEEPEGKE
jgi:5-methylcytosine-specific restriction endonuclease McrA